MSSVTHSDSVSGIKQFVEVIAEFGFVPWAHNSAMLTIIKSAPFQGLYCMAVHYAGSHLFDGMELNQCKPNCFFSHLNPKIIFKNANLN